MESEDLAEIKTLGFGDAHLLNEGHFVELRPDVIGELQSLNMIIDFSGLAARTLKTATDVGGRALQRAR